MASGLAEPDPVLPKLHLHDIGMTLKNLINTTALRFKMLGFLISIVGSAFGITICAVGLGMYVTALLTQLLLGGKHDWRPYPYPKTMSLLLVSLTVSLFISDYFNVSLRGYWKYLEGFILLYAGLDVVRDWKSVRLAYVTLLTAFCLSVAAGLWQSVFGYDFIYFRGAVEYKGLVPRITGAFKHCNDYATYLVPSFTVFLSCMLVVYRKNRKAFILLGLCFIGSVCALLLTISRGALISVFFSVIIFVWHFRFRKWAYAAIVAVGILLAVIPSPISERFNNILENSGSASERMILMKTAWKMTGENPFFGLGLNTYSDNFPKFRPDNYPDIMYAHNSYLQIASEAGLMGFGLYFAIQLMLVGRIFVHAGKPQKTACDILAIGLASGLAGIMMNALFDSLFQSTQLRSHYWVLLGLAYGVLLNLRNANGDVR